MNSRNRLPPGMLAPLVASTLLASAAWAAPVDVAGQMRCSERQGRFRDGTRTDAPFSYRFELGKVEHGKSTAQRYGSYEPGDARGSYYY